MTAGLSRPGAFSPGGRVRRAVRRTCLLGVVGLVGAVLAISAGAQPAADGWTEASPLSQTAGVLTLLPNGKVLSTNGGDSRNATELFDPAHSSDPADATKGTWATCSSPQGQPAPSPSPDCPAPSAIQRFLPPSATLVPDGNVLVVGGEATSTPQPAEIYHPSTGTWTDAATPLAARRGHSVVVLEDKTVLVIGGRGTPLPESETYDPDENRWTPTGPMIFPNRFLHTATQLQRFPAEACGANCGNIVAVGGGINDADPQDTVEIYNPTARAWVPGPPMESGHWGHTATLLDGPACRTGPRPAYCGRVLIAGGYALRGGGGPAPSELFDPAGDLTSAWASCPSDSATSLCPGPMVTPRWGHFAVLLADGRILAGGGQQIQGDRINSVEIYDPGTGRWTAIGSTGMHHARFQDIQSVVLTEGPSRKCLLNCGRLLVTGGLSGNGPDTHSAELFGPLSPLPDPPSITRLSPDRGPVSGGTRVEITGTDLDLTTSLSFGTSAISTRPCPPGGGTGATPCFTIISPTQISAYSPASDGPKTVDVQIQAGPELSPLSPASKFTYELLPSGCVVNCFPVPVCPPDCPRPVIHRVDPSCVPTSGGTQVTLSGTGFASGSTVKVGELPANEVQVLSAERITAKTPPQGPAKAPVSVTNGQGGSAVFTEFQVSDSCNGLRPAREQERVAPGGLSSGKQAALITGNPISTPGGPTGLSPGQVFSTGQAINAQTVTQAAVSSQPAAVPGTDVAGQMHVAGIPQPDGSSEEPAPQRLHSVGYAGTAMALAGLGSGALVLITLCLLSVPMTRPREEAAVQCVF